MNDAGGVDVGPVMKDSIITNHQSQQEDSVVKLLSIKQELTKPQLVSPAGNRCINGLKRQHPIVIDLELEDLIPEKKIC